jgi:RimJ/RimL family protein N-acetyltransferase
MPHSQPWLEAAGVGLHLLEEADAPHLTEWMNDPEMRSQQLVSGPITETRIRQFIASLWDRGSGDMPGHVGFAVVVPDAGFVGVVTLKDVSHHHGTAEIKTLVARSHWNRGIGFVARMLMLRYGFIDLRLRKIRSTIGASNTRSRRCGAKCGYREEGLLRGESYMNGELIDVVLAAIFRDDWLPLWEQFQRDEASRLKPEVLV